MCAWQRYAAIVLYLSEFPADREVDPSICTLPQ